MTLKLILSSKNLLAKGSNKLSIIPEQYESIFLYGWNAIGSWEVFELRGDSWDMSSGNIRGNNTDFSRTFDGIGVFAFGQLYPPFAISYTLITVVGDADTPSVQTPTPAPTPPHSCATRTCNK
jgi:hypothetical protein